jgi:hypothetical protein
MSRSCKFVLIGLGVLVVLCLLVALFSSLIVKKEYRSSTYGVGDRNLSALVVQNNSVLFILDVQLTGDADKTWDSLIRPASQKSFSISPGDYTVSIHYSDHEGLSSVGSLDWYVSSYESAKFSVAKGRAVIFSLEGGHTGGIMYTPPDLDQK